MLDGEEPREPTLLRALIVEKHWQRFDTFQTQFKRAALELAEMVGEQALRTISVERRQFIRWYGGDVKTVPRPDACRVLEHMFGRSVQELLSPASASGDQQQVSEGASSTTIALPSEPNHLVIPTAFWTPDTRSSDVRGDYPGSSIGVESPERLVAMAARKAYRFGSSHNASNVGGMALEHLQSEVSRLAVAYEQNPLPSVIGDIVALQDQTFFLLEGRQRPRETRDLYVVAGLASGLLAKCANDLADPHSAMTHARTAVVCGENAEFPSLIAWVRGIQCLVSHWAGTPRETIRYAELGLNLSGVSGSVTVWLHSLEARAWASLGDAAESERHINLASDARESMTPGELDRLGGFCYFPRARQLYYAAGANALLPAKYSRAEADANEALDAYANGPAAERAWSDVYGTYTELAIARVHGSDLDGAAEALRPVLELPVPQRIHGMVVSTLKVHQAVTAHGADSVAGRDLQEAIEAYARTPAASLPR